MNAARSLIGHNSRVDDEEKSSRFRLSQTVGGLYSHHLSSDRGDQSSRHSRRVITSADGGFELMDGFHLARQHFSVDDFTTIYQMLQSLEQEVGGGMTNVKHKLESLHPNLANNAHSHKLLIDLSTTAEERARVRTILQAIDQLRTIGFTYLNAHGSMQEREVEPGKLFWERGAWYLEGFCLSKEANRMFRVSRMTNLRMLERSFQPRHYHPDTDEHPPSGIHAHLRFLPSAAPRVTEHFKEECHQIDGQFEVQTVFYDMHYAVSVVLSYGAKVTVLSPQELRDALHATIREIEHIYDIDNSSSKSGHR